MRLEGHLRQTLLVGGSCSTIDVQAELLSPGLFDHPKTVPLLDA
jgi:hypothetical protein